MNTPDVIFRTPPTPVRSGRGRPRAKQALIAADNPGEWIVWTVRAASDKKERNRLSALAQSIRRYAKQDNLNWETAVRTEDDGTWAGLNGPVIVLYVRVTTQPSS
jgi:hypothetical protein